MPMSVGSVPPESASTSSSPAVVRGLGLEAKFRYWRGASGRRYLFSAVEADELADLDGGVVLIPHNDQFAEGTPAWIGELRAQSGSAQFSTLPGRPAFVHLLARSPGERQAVIDDLARIAA